VGHPRKVAGLPIHQLLAASGATACGSMRASVGGTAVAGAMARRAEAAVKRGFTAVKIRQDYGPVPPDRSSADLVEPREVLAGSTSGGTGP